MPPESGRQAPQPRMPGAGIFRRISSTLCLVPPDSPRGTAKAWFPETNGQPNCVDGAAEPRAYGSGAALVDSTRRQSLLLAEANANESSTTMALAQIERGIQKQFASHGKKISKLHMLGKGGFGEVWLAMEDRRPIALKELKSPLRFRPNSRTANDVLKSLPFSEAAIQALMVHDNVVRTYWADVMIVDLRTRQPLSLELSSAFPEDQSETVDSCGWTQVHALLDKTSALQLPDEVGLVARIAMEYCDAGALLDYIRPKRTRGAAPPKPLRPLSVVLGGGMDHNKCAMMTALDIARGLKLLHIQRVVHGDLKPHNILLCKQKQDPRGFVAKVTDFGLSAHMRAGEDSIKDITCGSRPYMAPESLRDRALTTMSDVYGFGVLMWELWHNEFWGTHHANELQIRMSQDPSMPLTGMADFVPRCSARCPPPYAGLVNRCVLLDPAARPRIRDVVKELENMIYG